MELKQQLSLRALNSINNYQAKTSNNPVCALFSIEIST
jgi:hypothetical protein